MGEILFVFFAFFFFFLNLLTCLICTSLWLHISNSNTWVEAADDTFCLRNVETLTKYYKHATKEKAFFLSNITTCGQIVYIQYGAVLILFLLHRISIIEHFYFETILQTKCVILSRRLLSQPVLTVFFFNFIVFN